MNLERLVNSQTGKIVISVVLGLGLASLFHTVCNDDKCLSFNGPVISDVEDKIFKYGNGINLEKTKLNIKARLHLFFLFPVFLFLKYAINSSIFLQELYEFLFVKFIPCYEIIYLIRKE
mgnify:CR=1 FL=1